MEKLEQIMRAEESARRAASSAKDRAREIRKQAGAEAELAEAAVRRDGSEQAALLRAEILREADAVAVEKERAAEVQLDKTVQRAEEDLTAAADALVAAVKG